MAAGGHFEKKIKKLKLRIDLKWREMRSKVIFGHPKWPPAAILDDQKSLSIAFLAISDQYATLIFLFFFQNGGRRPF